jgi:hypothetical protein
MKPCKIWTGARSKAGYGQRRIKGVTYYVHRQEWEKHHGPIPPGILIRHTCDNPPCYEISHLVPGTDATNKADSVAKRRHCFGEKVNTAKLTEAQVIAIMADTRPQKIIASEYPVSVSMISHIKRGHSWRHIHPPRGNIGRAGTA